MNTGGAERVASILSNSWVSKGYKVILMPTFSGRGPCFYELSPDVQLIYLADLITIHTKTWLNQIKRLFTLRQFIRTEQPDVIVSFLYNVNVAAIIASFGLGVPVIICERTDPFITPISRWLQIACRFTYPLSKLLIVQTQSVLNKYVTSGWSLKQLAVIANPVTFAMQNIQPSKSNTATKQLISIGRLDEGKQFDLLISIFSRLAKHHANWTLKIIGDGILRADLQQQITDLGLESRIELAGPSMMIGEELKQADIFAFTSKHEGFPNALIEAMSEGLPCVAFDCPSGPREITMDGQVALLIPLNDEQAFKLALERLMLDADLRDALGKKGRASVISRFSLDKIMKQWDVLFQEIGIKS